MPHRALLSHLSLLFLSQIAYFTQKNKNYINLNIAAKIKLIGKDSDTTFHKNLNEEVRIELQKSLK
jgi:hypothetical protein